MRERGCGRPVAVGLAHGESVGACRIGTRRVDGGCDPEELKYMLERHGNPPQESHEPKLF